MRDIELCDRMTLSVMEDVKLLEPTKYLTRERERERESLGLSVPVWDSAAAAGGRRRSARARHFDER